MLVAILVVALLVAAVLVEDVLMHFRGGESVFGEWLRRRRTRRLRRFAGPNAHLRVRVSGGPRS